MKLTKQAALADFRAIDDSPRGDYIWRREAWNNYTDALCKDGLITVKQYETWANPF